MTGARRPWLVAGLLWAITLVAAAITIPVGVARHAGPGPAAPGLAALTDEQLAALLPVRADFPDGWTTEPFSRHDDDFGYWRYHRAQDLGTTTPEECDDVQYGASTDTSLAVEIAGEAPTGARPSRHPGDVRVVIGREFRPAGFDEMIERVYRCTRFSSGMSLLRTRSTVQILEDARPRGRPQIFRYTVTTDYGGPAHHASVRHYSYARASRLVLSGNSIAAEAPLLDRLFAQTLGRIQAAGC